MRWKEPQNGDRRIRRFFAWVPVGIDESCLAPGEHREVRWWETVRVYEAYYGYGQRWLVAGFLDGDEDEPRRLSRPDCMNVDEPEGVRPPAPPPPPRPSCDRPSPPSCLENLCNECMCQYL